MKLRIIYLSSNANPANIEDFNGILVSFSKLTNHLRFVHLQAETVYTNLIATQNLLSQKSQHQHFIMFLYLDCCNCMTATLLGSSLFPFPTPGLLPPCFLLLYCKKCKHRAEMKDKTSYIIPGRGTIPSHSPGRGGR